MTNAFEIPKNSIHSPAKTAKSNKPVGWYLSEKNLNKQNAPHPNCIKVHERKDYKLDGNFVMRHAKSVALKAFSDRYPDRVDD